MSLSLNREQERAAATLEGSVIISAGAGTGKTRALAERFVRAVAPTGIDGWLPARVVELLTITFTDKAAGELVERVRTTLRSSGLAAEARELDAAWVSTIHGFCARILRRHALEAGLDPAFAVADETVSAEVAESAFEGAASVAFERSTGVRDLFDSYDFAAVRAAVFQIHRALRTHGLVSEDLVIETAPDATALYEEVVRTALDVEPDFLRHASAIKGAANYAAACRALRETLGALDPQAMKPRELAGRLWWALADFRPQGSASAVRDSMERVDAARAKGLAAAAAIVVAPDAEALVELAGQYERVLSDAKAERGVLDFADLQLEAARLFRGHPRLRERYRDQFRLVMVDEFQDTDEVQMSLVRSVSRDNLCTVGDERQSIYRFRGADLDVYRRHRVEMCQAGAADIRLHENYRSHPEVIGFVNELFSGKDLFGDDLLKLSACRSEPETPLVPHGEPRVGIDLVHAPGRSQRAARHTETEALAGHLADLRDAGVCPGDMAVLVRRHADAAPVATALRRRGFAALVLGGRTLLGLPEVRMVRALCRAIANPRDDEALACLLLSPMSALEDSAVWLLRNAEQARVAGRYLWDGLSVADDILSSPAAAHAHRFRRVIERARARAGAHPLSEVLMRAVEESEADLVFARQGDEGLQALSNVVRFTRKADEFERAGGAGAAAFAARIDTEESFGQQESVTAVADDRSPAVRIMTVHAAKGLEFPVVALPFLSGTARSDSRILRTRARGDGLEFALRLPSEWGEKPELRRTQLFAEMHEQERAAQSEEAKRRFYVACTRAREVLLLSGCANLEKPPEGDTELALMRKALGVSLDNGIGTESVRNLPGGTRVRLTVREAIDPPRAETSPPAGSHDGCGEGTRAAPLQPPDEVRRIVDGLAATPVTRISFSDIGVYELCSLRYWAERVARIGDVEGGADDDARRFGSALHAALQLAVVHEFVSQERIDAIARFHRLGPEDTVRLGRAVRRVEESAVASAIAVHERVSREHPFSVRFEAGESPFDLVGAMDVYALTGSDALIVDYKSGTSAASPDELRERYSLQAECYAYAALRDGRESARVTFVRPEVEDADGGIEQVDFTFTRADGPELEAIILAAHVAMTSRPYQALATWDPSACPGCRVCGTLCPVTPPRRVSG